MKTYQMLISELDFSRTRQNARGKITWVGTTDLEETVELPETNTVAAMQKLAGEWLNCPTIQPSVERDERGPKVVFGRGVNGHTMFITFRRIFS